MAHDPEEFDVEAWNRRLRDTPSEPPERPRGGAAPVDVVDPMSRFGPSDPSSDDGLPPDPFGPGPGHGVAAGEVQAHEGFGAFEHGQWTVEGEIERFGAFGRGAARARGWKRGVALVLLGLLVLPLVLEAGQLLARLLS